ncbi:MAG TPA: ABC transporter permease [Clostridiales bacterium]|nr:ABC transporter permease [Clostridiales bacterium]
MKPRTFGYLLKEGFKNIGRNKVMTTAAVFSIIASLFIFGVVLLIVFNVQNTADTLDSQVEIIVYLKDEISEAEVRKIGKQLEAMNGVDEVSYQSKADALRAMKEQLGDSGEILEGYTEETNPLPRSFSIKIHNPEWVRAVASNIEDKPWVETIKYNKEVVDTIERVTSAMRNGGVVLVIILAVVTIFVVSNTIKLAVISRRREISIMKYVGASDWFIRWPFVLEGAILGIIGAFIATLAIMFFYDSLLSKAGGFAFFVTLVPIEQVFKPIILSFLAIGIVVGILGSVISIRKYLKV